MLLLNIGHNDGHFLSNLCNIDLKRTHGYNVDDVFTATTKCVTFFRFFLNEDAIKTLRR